MKPAYRILSFIGYLGAAGCLAWTAAWDMGEFLPSDLAPWVRGLITFFLALIILTLTSASIGKLLGRRRPDIPGTFNQAFQRIARGDYTVQIPTGPRGHLHHFESMAENLNTMAETLARVEELRHQFTADVSHEFQSPLTSILGFAQALQAGGLPDNLRTPRSLSRRLR